jgi:AcrR family transcriptional regulator
MPAVHASPQRTTDHRQRKREAMIARILDAAREIMRQEGVAALSMQELARRMDLRAPSLYNYFSSKMDVYDALFRLGFTLFGEHLAQAVQGAQTWQDEVRLTIEAYMSFALDNPELYQLCFERPVPGFVPSEASLELSFGALQQGYRRAGELISPLRTGLSDQQAADLLIALMHGLTAQHLSNEPDMPVGEGRFGSLIPVVMSILEKAWTK